MRFLVDLIFPQRNAESELAYQRAIVESRDLIKKMRGSPSMDGVAQDVVSDIWAQSHNVPFMVTVVEAVQEMKSGIEQRSVDR